MNDSPGALPSQTHIDASKRVELLRWANELKVPYPILRFVIGKVGPAVADVRRELAAQNAASGFVEAAD